MKKLAPFLFLALLDSICLAIGLGGAPAPPPAGQKVPVVAKPQKTPMAMATDAPRIVEFVTVPATILEGGEATLRWRVEPGSTGSPIDSLEITSVAPTGSVGRVYARLLLSGEYPIGSVSTGGRGRWSYTLKVVDRAGRSANRTVDIVTGTLDSFLAGLSGFTLDIETTVDGARRDHIATVSLDNGSGIGSGRVMIYLYQAYAPLMLDVDIPDGYLVGNLAVADLAPGHNEFRLAAALHPTAPVGESRRLNKLVLLVVKEHSPGVIERTLFKALCELIDTREAGETGFGVRVIKVG